VDEEEFIRQYVLLVQCTETSARSVYMHYLAIRCGRKFLEGSIEGNGALLTANGIPATSLSFTANPRRN
jgi:hypothetical protein